MTRKDSVEAIKVDPQNKNSSMHVFIPNASIWRRNGHTFKKFLTDDNGAMYFGEIKGGVASGHGTLECSNGVSYVGRFYLSHIEISCMNLECRDERI